MQELNVALAKLARHREHSASRINAAAEQARKCFRRDADATVKRLNDFFWEHGAEGHLKALYVLNVALVEDKKKSEKKPDSKKDSKSSSSATASKTSYMAEMFKTRLARMIEAFRSSKENEKRQVSKVLGRWLKYELFSAAELRLWADRAGCTLGVDASKPAPSSKTPEGGRSSLGGPGGPPIEGRSQDLPRQFGNLPPVMPPGHPGYHPGPGAVQGQFSQAPASFEGRGNGPGAPVPILPYGGGGAPASAGFPPGGPRDRDRNSSDRGRDLDNARGGRDHRDHRGAPPGSGRDRDWGRDRDRDRDRDRYRDRDDYSRDRNYRDRDYRGADRPGGDRDRFDQQRDYNGGRNAPHPHQAPGSYNGSSNGRGSGSTGGPGGLNLGSAQSLLAKVNASKASSRRHGEEVSLGGPPRPPAPPAESRPSIPQAPPGSNSMPPSIPVPPRAPQPPPPPPSLNQPTRGVPKSLTGGNNGKGSPRGDSNGNAPGAEPSSSASGAGFGAAKGGWGSITTSNNTANNSAPAAPAATGKAAGGGGGGWGKFK